MKRSLLLTLCVAAGALACAQAAQAGSQTLSATYYSVPNSGADPDFEQPLVGSSPWYVPNVSLGSSLGPNGLPVATSPYGVSDVTAGGEITWWSPSLNPNVTQTGTGFISLPYGPTTMFPPNSTGSSNADAFETAIFKGDIDLTSASGLTKVTFNLRSDDDALIYIDGKYIGGLPGIHAPESTSIDDYLTAADHSLEIFYADRHTTDAVFGLSITPDSIMVSPGPTPGAGVLGLAFLILAGAVTRMRGLMAR